MEYVLDDYRNISGEFDVFVSVGMLEHVGTAYYPTLGNVINRCLKPGGRGLIHSIGRNRPRPMNAWIERRIFPGAYPPTLREMMHIFETNRLSVLDVENLRMHYALTLKAWLQRYEQHAGQVEEMMDERFVRTWRLYLAGSQAAFTSGQLQLFQLVFAREEDNDIPWSRTHQYANRGAPIPMPWCARMIDTEVLIIGGGPAGSTLARALTQAGKRVVVMDKARVSTRQGVRGLGYTGGFSGAGNRPGRLRQADTCCSP